jgi:hypothetical protein|tara:strand:- start:238 stop:570 length:333 start_codon:yes stop_codon:yes gene_type:complete
MKGFIQRLALLIHWIAFGSVIYGVLAFLFRIVGKEPYTLEKIEAARGLLADPELETNSAYLTEQRQAAIATAQRMQAEGAFDGLFFLCSTVSSWSWVCSYFVDFEVVNFW